MSSPWKPDLAHRHPLMGDFDGVLLRDLTLRHIRRALLDPSVASEVAWCLMLELFMARRAKVEVTTSDLIDLSGVPYTTALRYIDHLESAGMILRYKSDRDGRVTLVELAKAGDERIIAYVSALRTFDAATPKQRAAILAGLKPRRGKSIFPWRWWVDNIDEAEVA